MTAPAYTDRSLPAPWGVCEVCGGPVAALADLDGIARCPACAQRERLTDAAQAHLDALLSPALGAWVNHYAPQGLSQETARELLGFWAGDWMHEKAQTEHLAALIAQAAKDYPAPQVVRADPDRVTLNTRTLPQLLGVIAPFNVPAPVAGEPDRRLGFRYRDAEGRVRETGGLPVGCDAVLLLNTTPEGEALLYFTGLHGRTNTREAEAYRVPAALLPDVRAALGYFGEAGQ